MTEFESGNPTDFDAAVKEGVTLVDFNAPWCAPCRAQEPVLAELEKTYADAATVLKVNIDNNREIAMKLGVQSIPTLIVFKEGREDRRFVGLQSADALKNAMEDAMA